MSLSAFSAFSRPSNPSFLLCRPPSKLHELAIDGDASALEALLREEGDSVDLNERDSYGYAALHLAVDRGTSSELLTSPTLQANRFVSAGNLETAKALLAAGADASLKVSPVIVTHLRFLDFTTAFSAGRRRQHTTGPRKTRRARQPRRPPLICIAGFDARHRDCITYSQRRTIFQLFRPASEPFLAPTASQAPLVRTFSANWRAVESCRAKRLRKQNCDGRYQRRADAEKANLAVLIKVSLTRPLCTFLLLPAPLPPSGVLTVPSQTSSVRKRRSSSSRCVPVPLLSFFTLPDPPRNASSCGHRFVGARYSSWSVRPTHFLPSSRLGTDFSSSSSRHPPHFRHRRAFSSFPLSPPLPRPRLSAFLLAVRLQTRRNRSDNASFLRTTAFLLVSFPLPLLSCGSASARCKNTKSEFRMLKSKRQRKHETTTERITKEE